MPLTDLVITHLRRRFEQVEGRIPYLYRDTKGFITIGIGCRVPTAEDAKALPLQNSATHLPATATEKAEEWKSIHEQKFGQTVTAQSFSKVAKLTLPDPDIDLLFKKRVLEFDASLRSIFGAKYDTFPDPAREALLDMIFNLGKYGLLHFTEFIKLVQAEDVDWAAAAPQSHRLKVGSRNKLVSDLLLQAAALKAATPKNKPVPI